MGREFTPDSCQLFHIDFCGYRIPSELMIRLSCAVDLSPLHSIKTPLCNSIWHYCKRILPIGIILLCIFGIVQRTQFSTRTADAVLKIYRPNELPPKDVPKTTIIVVTPTHRRAERLADMTRFANTLINVPNLHWVVVEDGNATVPFVERILQRSKIPYAYINTVTENGLPRRGWTHRNKALNYIRQTYKDYKHNSVVYFGDDDNSYDIRLFNEYIRNVKTIGIWAVGLSGEAYVEAPHVVDKKIVSWDTPYAPKRTFAVDMAGFAINLKTVQQFPNASFGKQCVKQSPETCFLRQFNIPKEKCQPFGYDSNPKEIYVWHTKTKPSKTRGTKMGYDIE